MGTPKWVGINNALIEQPNSPRTEWTRQGVTRTRTFKGLYSVCLASSAPAGAVGTGDDAGWLVNRCEVTKDRGRVGILTVVYGGLSTGTGTQLPLVKFSCDPEKIPRPLKYHWRYASLAESVLDAIDKALESNSPEGNQYYNSFSAIALAVELYNKRKRGTESFYLSGLKYWYTEASWDMPSLTMGGFLDTPDGPMAGALPAGGSWLRLADGFSGNGVYYETTRSWIGSPAGDWDTDIYAV